MKLSALRWGVLLFLIAALPRLGWVVWNWRQTGPELPYPDEELHWRLARNIVEKGEIVTDDGRRAARMPLYPLFLAIFASAESGGVLSARITQALLGAATTALLYAFIRRHLGHPPALLTAGLAAFDPFAIFFCNLLLTEVVFIMLSVALTACAWPLLRDPAGASRFDCLGVGAFGTAAILTRPSAAGWIALLWMVLWLFDSNRRRATIRGMGYLAILAIGLLPWGIRNYRVLGAPAWLSANGGVTLYDAQGPQADGSSNQAFMQELPELDELDEIQRDRVLRDLAWKQMRSDPARVVRLAVVKFRRTWSLIPNVAEHRSGPAAYASAAFTLGVLMPAVWACFRAFRRRRELPRELSRFYLLMLLPIAYFTLLHCIFVGSLRYRVPLLPFLAMIAGTLLLSRTARRDCDRT